MAARTDECPFCHSHDLDTKGWRVECHSCGAAGPLGHSAADAVELWNDRCKHIWNTKSVVECLANTHEAICAKCGQKPEIGGYINMPKQEYRVGEN